MTTEIESKPMPSLLLVDDDETYLKVLARSMSRRDYLVWPASTIALARQAIYHLSPTFAVVDLRLNDGSGLDVVSHLRERSPDTTVVMLSGYANVRSAVAAVKAGAVDCIAKPVDPDELDKALKSAQTGSLHMPDHFMHPDEARMQHILGRWAKNNWNTTKAAAELGLHRRSLQRMLRRAGFNGESEPGSTASKIMTKFPGLSRFWLETVEGQ